MGQAGPLCGQVFIHNVGRWRWHLAWHLLETLWHLFRWGLVVVMCVPRKALWCYHRERDTILYITKYSISVPLIRLHES